MLLSIIALVLAAHTAEPTRTIYVSPTGSDAPAEPGATVAPGDSPEHPLATLTAARDRLRALRTGPDGKPVPLGPTRVVLAPGLYTLGEPFALTAQDSGSEKAPVTFAAAQPGTVTISGGVQLPAWKPAMLNGRSVWAVKLPPSAAPAAAEKPTLRSLWIGNSRRTWARHPNGGAFAKIEAIPERPKGDWTVGPSSFRFAPELLSIFQAAAPDPHVEVTTFTRWVDSHLVLAAVEPPGRLARFTTPNVISLDPGDLYCIQGAAALLDEPGEWWADAITGMIYTMPLPDDSMDTPSFIPRLTELLTVRGDAATGRPAQHIRFENLTFAHARWWFTPGWRADWPAHKPIGFVQAAAGAPGAVICESASHITFDGCTIRAVEAYGVELGRGCTDCALNGCTITDLGAGGIKIGTTAIPAAAADLAGRNTVQDCTITDGGHIHHQAVGIWVGQSPGNTIAHNLIAEFDYTGISIGWTWGYGNSALSGGSNGTTVEWNEVRNLGARPGNAEPPLGDMAGIYTLGMQQGGVIRHNYFHDIAGRTIAWGIYFDEGTTGVTAEENIVLRTTHGGFHQHYGKDNTVRRNLFVDGRDAQLWRTRREAHTSFTFADNVVVAGGVSGKGAAGAADQWLAGDWSGGVVTSHNLYWRTDGKPILFPGKRTLAQWQKEGAAAAGGAANAGAAQGMETGSVIADPDLVLTDPTDPTFGPKAAPEAKAFTLPHLKGVGPRKR